MIRSFILILLLLLLFTACGSESVLEDKAPDGNDLLENIAFEISPLKWFNGKKAAMSMTYDGRWGHWKWQPKFEDVVNAAYVRQFAIDFEFVTSNFIEEKFTDIRDDIRNRAMKRGVHFYGHGHTHSYYDSLSYEESYDSFKLCYDHLNEWGMEPRAFAYPYGAGRTPAVQQAVQDAGFICARGVTTDPSIYYICPEDVSEPDNWYYLPTVPSGEGMDGYLSSHADMAPIIATAHERSSWIIIMYHAVGFKDDWGYYPLNEFYGDINQMFDLDFWGGNMDMVACYIKERNAFSFNVISAVDNGDSIEYELVFSDGLDNTVFSQPLTLDCEFDSSLGVNTVEILTDSDTKIHTRMTGNTARFNIIPDEKTYRMRITTGPSTE